MFAATFNDKQIFQIIETTERAETREQEHARLVAEATENLSNMPGNKGKQLRRALTCGWC
ncbi:MAG: hypothetical protein HQ514_16240 [Rhodospirillales bacterium]|nr:hypothetical protein [Rhodospirillales bacterium]